MTTPAPHTPIALVKAGGTQFFSAKCIELLSKAGFEMQEFGTYESVQEYHRNCRLRREKYGNPEAWKKRDPKPEIKPASEDRPPASQREWQLGEPTRIPDPDKPGRMMDNPLAFQSGHMVMNSTQQADRGQPCTNYVTGHVDNDFPCVSHQGPAHTPNGIHRGATEREYQGAFGKANFREKGGPYAGKPVNGAAQCREDAQARNRYVLDQTRRSSVGSQSPLKSAEGYKDAKIEDKTKVDDLPGTTPVKPADMRAADESTVKGDTALECMNNFMDMAAEGMRQKVKANVQKHRDAAKKGCPPAKEGTTRDWKKADAQVRAQNEKIEQLEEEKKKHKDNPHVQAQLDQEIAEAKETRAEATAWRTRCNHACLASQGERLKRRGERGPRNDPRVPGGYRGFRARTARAEAAAKARQSG